MFEFQVFDKEKIKYKSNVKHWTMAEYHENKEGWFGHF